MPQTRSAAMLMLGSAARYLDCTEYNRRKASKLLEALADLLAAEVMFECNLADIGFAGCTE